MWVKRESFSSLRRSRLLLREAISAPLIARQNSIAIATRCRRSAIPDKNPFCRRRQHMTPLERTAWCFFVRCPREGTFVPADNMCIRIRRSSTGTRRPRTTSCSMKPGRATKTFSTSNYIGRTVRLGMTRCRGCCSRSATLRSGSQCAPIASSSSAPLPRKFSNRLAIKPSSLGVLHGRELPVLHGRKLLLDHVLCDLDSLAVGRE